MLYCSMNRMMLMDLIRVKNVNKQYKNGVTAIYDLSLNIKKGSFVLLLSRCYTVKKNQLVGKSM